MKRRSVQEHSAASDALHPRADARESGTRSRDCSQSLRGIDPHGPARTSRSASTTGSGSVKSSARIQRRNE
jgi:hypothetical protein